ncbi:DUF998 domain-containing protein [Micromonospora sp. NBC_00362]|nr:DUF998 domain-containing protein [Micromonospora sp. NBC_00362]
MSDVSKLKAFCFLAAGPLFLIANIVAGLGWRKPPYSWAEHNISDLGNVYCGQWDTTRPRYVCSPWHDGFNASILVVVALVVLGVLLTWNTLGRGGAVRTAQGFVLAGVLGFALAAARPADIDENLHFLGALLIFIGFNLGPVAAAFARRDTLLGGMRTTSAVLGIVALTGTVLFLAQVDVGIGIGGMERVPVFTPLLWLALVGWRVHRRAHR